MRPDPATGKLVPAVSGDELVELLGVAGRAAARARRLRHVRASTCTASSRSGSRSGRRARCAGRDRRASSYPRHRHDGGERLPRRPPARLGDAGRVHGRAARRRPGGLRRAAQLPRRRADGGAPRKREAGARSSPSPASCMRRVRLERCTRAGCARSPRPATARSATSTESGSSSAAAPTAGRRRRCRRARAGRPDPPPRGQRRALLRDVGRVGAAGDRARGHRPRQRERRRWSPRSGRPSQRGVAVAVCSRCSEGRVEPVYGRGGGRDLADAGALFAGDLGGPKARVLLQLALGGGARARGCARRRGRMRTLPARCSHCGAGFGADLGCPAPRRADGGAECRRLRTSRVRRARRRSRSTRRTAGSSSPARTASRRGRCARTARRTRRDVGEHDASFRRPGPRESTCAADPGVGDRRAAAGQYYSFVRSTPCTRRATRASTCREPGRAADQRGASP